MPDGSFPEIHSTCASPRTFSPCRRVSVVGSRFSDHDHVAITAIHFTPTERGEYRLIPNLSATYAMASCAFTLLPALSSGGANTAMAPLPGTTAMIPPPTPLFAGSPTCHAQPPDPSYRPAIVIVARISGTFSRL